jgi:hypothetical protein
MTTGSFVSQRTAWFQRDSFSQRQLAGHCWTRRKLTQCSSDALVTRQQDTPSPLSIQLTSRSME